MSARGVASRFEGVARGDEGGSTGFVSITIGSSVIVGSFSVFSSSGSGDAEGFGVGSTGAKNEGAPSATLGALDILLFLMFARTLCLGALFFGGAFFVGDAGAAASSSSVGVNICDGSTDSLALVRRVLLVAGVNSEVSFAVFRLAVRVVLAGAGVKSSSLSSFWAGCSSSSESSTIFLLDAAALREGRVGDALDMICGWSWSW